MNLSNPVPGELAVQGLVEAIALNKGDDTLALVLAPSQWETLSNYMQPVSLTAGQVLFKQGAADRTLYFVQSGALQVHLVGDPGRAPSVVVIVGPGSVVGEGGFFSNLPRSATVQVDSACTLWSLSRARFQELAHRKPDIALEVTLAAAAVVARRMMMGKYRSAVT